MSSQQKKEDKKSSDSGVGTAVTAGIAVAGAAAVAYGAWRLYDFFSSPPTATATPTVSEAEKKPKKMSDSSDGDYVSPPAGRRQVGEIPEIPDQRRPTNTNFNSSNGNAETTPASKLLNYYRNYVELQPVEVREVRKVVKSFKMKLSRRLQALNMGNVLETGSSLDGLMVVVPENFDFLIPFQLKAEDCSISYASDTSEYILVSAHHADGAWLDAVSDDKSCLVPSKFVDLLKEHLEEAVIATGHESLKLVMREASAVIEGHNGLKKFMINIIPALQFEDRCLVAEAPVASDASDSKGGSWRESFHSKEYRYLDRFGPSISGQKVILKIFKAIRLNFPLQFGILSSYDLKTILFHVMDYQNEPGDWEMSAVSERFIDFLIELGNCLKDKNLPHYFRPDCNLFDRLSPETSQDLAQFVNKIVGQHDFTTLLICDYPQP